MTQVEFDERTAKWQLDEEFAKAYERNLVPILFRPGAEMLVQLAELISGERVLDVACGTGIVARCAARILGDSGSVVGLDVNEGMLSVASKVAREDGLETIEWTKGDAAALPFPDGSFDAVFCQQGLQFFPDPQQSLKEMRRVLADQGRLTLSVLRPIDRNPGWLRLADVMERHFGPKFGGMMRTPFSSYSTASEVKDLFARAGFPSVKIILGIGPVRYPSARELLFREVESSPVAGLFNEISSESQEAAIRDLQEAFADYTDDDSLVFPAETYLVVARR